MKEEHYQFSYQVFDSLTELNAEDQELLKAAQDAASISYAPYSDFHVGAAARMKSGKIIKGGNQENAAFPAGLCAEGVVLAVASSLYPGEPVNTLAITYKTTHSENDHPITPCGICRQSLQEFRERTGSPVRLIMVGMTGKIYILSDASSLLPLAFRF